MFLWAWAWPWGRSSLYFLPPVTIPLIVPPRLKNSEHTCTLNTFLGNCSFLLFHSYSISVSIILEAPSHKSTLLQLLPPRFLYICGNLEYSTRSCSSTSISNARFRFQTVTVLAKILSCKNEIVLTKLFLMYMYIYVHVIIIVYTEISQITVQYETKIHNHVVMCVLLSRYNVMYTRETITRTQLCPTSRPTTSKTSTATCDIY